MLEVKELVKSYRSLRAVDGLSFSVGSNEIVGLLGPNGAGKTTALRCIAGILRPSAGSILVDGHDTVRDDSEAKSRLAFVPEVPNLYELLTVEEHLRFIAMCYKRLDLFEELRDELFERYELTDKRKDLVATLSKGTRQKLSIACALVHDATTMLFDEPIIGIDPAGVAEFKRELFRQREKGAAILISTHLLDTAETFCDRVVIMSKGKKLAEGTMAELRALSRHESATLEEIFLTLTKEEKAVEAPPVSV